MAEQCYNSNKGADLQHYLLNNLLFTKSMPCPAPLPQVPSIPTKPSFT